MAIAAPPGLAESSTSPSGRSAAVRPAALWKAFPLRPARTGAFLPPRTERLVVGAPMPPAVVRPSGSSRDTWVVASGIVALIAAASGAAVLLLVGPERRWRRTATAAVSHGRLGAARLLGDEHAYVLVLPGRKGWGDRIVEREGDPPLLGEVIFDDELGSAGQAYVVRVVGRSPLPGDKRSCAFLRAIEG